MSLFRSGDGLDMLSLQSVQSLCNPDKDRLRVSCWQHQRRSGVHVQCRILWQRRLLHTVPRLRQQCANVVSLPCRTFVGQCLVHMQRRILRQRDQMLCVQCLRHQCTANGRLPSWKHSKHSGVHLQRRILWEWAHLPALLRVLSECKRVYSMQLDDRHLMLLQRRLLWIGDDVHCVWERNLLVCKM